MQEGRLARLRYLVWQEPSPADEAALAALRAACPRLLCNPVPRLGQRLPAAADAAADLDAPALDPIGFRDPMHPAGQPAWLAVNATRGGEDAPGNDPNAPAARRLGPAVVDPAPGAEAAAPTLAQRFAAAYASRAAKLREEHARNVRRAERRRLAALSGAERAVRMAELGVPLQRLRR